MQTLATIMSFASGFALTGYNGGAVNLLATSIIINLSLAPLTAVAAYRRGRSGLAWGIIGLALGMWALAWVLIFLTPRSRYESSPSADSDPPRAA
ncbi:MAG: hypothetical protein ABSD31_22020 [Candidatus Binataceae bacterium]|jgi:hypothetical protein